MDLSRARFLVSPQASAALESETELAALPLHARATRLREMFDPREAAALSEQVELRARYRERFGREPGHRRLTREGLEMLTHPLVALRRALRLAALDRPIADLTSGIGGDLEALADAAHAVVGVERDAASALLAAHNVPAAAVERGDALRPPVDVPHTVLFFDPSRRSGSFRRFDPQSFSPPWDACLDLLAQAFAGAMKGPPGIQDAAIPQLAEVEFVQVGRGLREAGLYLGANARPGLRCAVILPAGYELASDAPGIATETATIGPVLYDPASAVTRAGVVRQLGHQLNARMVDRHLAYLTSAEPVSTPFADTFTVLDLIPFSVARLKKRLRERMWAPHEIRRRAFPIEPDDLRRQLGRIEGDPVTLICTTVAGQRLVIVANLVQKPTKIA